MQLLRGGLTLEHMAVHMTRNGSALEKERKFRNVSAKKTYQLLEKMIWNMLYPPPKVQKHQTQDVLRVTAFCQWVVKNAVLCFCPENCLTKRGNLVSKNHFNYQVYNVLLKKKTQEKLEKCLKQPSSKK